MSTREKNESTGNELLLEKIRVGVSSCLLGQEVRFDGGHKRDNYLTGTLSSYFDFIPFCPEAAVGLGIPRQPIRLVRRGEEIRAVGVRTPELDPTDQLAAFAERTARQLGEISGYILKKDSPSCGMERVKIYNDKGMPERKGVGIYAGVLMQRLPLLPVEEEGRLGDAVLRENFIERVFVYHRWQRLVRKGLSAKGLIEFHSDHKFLILSHQQKAYRELGRLVANAGGSDLEKLAGEYVAILMNALKRPARPRKHVNVLEHLLGFLKEHLDKSDREEMAETIAQYREGLLPLIVPITLIRHHFRRHPDPYIQRQYYISPHPKELMLRNSI